MPTNTPALATQKEDKPTTDPVVDLLLNEQKTDIKLEDLQKKQSKQLNDVAKQLKDIKQGQTTSTKQINNVVVEQKDLQKDLQTLKEEQQNLKTEVLIGDDQWSKIAKAGQDTEIYAGAWLNILLGVILGYIAARGFFDSWR